MEAPEKIYIHVRANKELGTTWHGKTRNLPLQSTSLMKSSPNSVS